MFTWGLRQWSRGAVSRVEVDEGRLVAVVGGDVSTALMVGAVSAGKWYVVLGLLGVESGWLDACRASDRDALLLLVDAAAARGVDLGPQEDDDLVVTCTCGMGEELCWHAVALVQAVAEQVDEDPWLWLRARGLTAEAFNLLEIATVVQAPTAERLQYRKGNFWTGTAELDPLPAARPRVALDERSDSALRDVFRPEFVIRGRNRTAVERHVEAAVKALRTMYADLVAAHPPIDRNAEDEDSVN